MAAAAMLLLLTEASLLLGSSFLDRIGFCSESEEDFGDGVTELLGEAGAADDTEAGPLMVVALLAGLLLLISLEGRKSWMLLMSGTDGETGSDLGCCCCWDPVPGLHSEFGIMSGWALFRSVRS